MLTYSLYSLYDRKLCCQGDIGKQLPKSMAFPVQHTCIILLSAAHDLCVLPPLMHTKA